MNQAPGKMQDNDRRRYRVFLSLSMIHFASAEATKDQVSLRLAVDFVEKGHSIAPKYDPARIKALYRTGLTQSALYADTHDQHAFDSPVE